MSIRRTLPLFLSAALLSLAFDGAASQAESVRWRNNVDGAKIEATQSGKLVLLHFWTTSCGPCRTLERDVFSQPLVGDFLEQNFVPVKVDAELAPALAIAYEIDRVPTDVVLTPQGNVVAKLSCPMDASGYATQLGNVASHYAQFMAQPGAPAQPPVQSAYNGLQVGQYNAQPAASASISSSPATVTPTAAYTSNPYAAAPPASPGAAPQAEPAPQGINNPYAERRPLAQQAAPQAAPRQQIVTTAQLAAKLPPGSPPLAFEGFCPVTLKTSHKWVAGNPQFGAIHRGRTFLFTGDAQRQQFLANPDAYSPVFSGMDPVLILDQQQAVEGSRRYGYEYRGAFYLFHNQETMARFANDPDRYSAQARQAMNRMDAHAGGPTYR
jgi:protein disulfide-isomerase